MAKLTYIPQDDGSKLVMDGDNCIGRLMPICDKLLVSTPLAASINIYGKVKLTLFDGGETIEKFSREWIETHGETYPFAKGDKHG